MHKDRFLRKWGTKIPQISYPEATELKIRKVFGVDEVTYPNLAGAHQDYQKFILLTTQRSGSALLTLLLRSHPHIVCYNEIFHPDFCAFDYPFFPRKEDPEILSFRNSKPKKFLQDLPSLAIRKAFL